MLHILTAYTPLPLTGYPSSLKRHAATLTQHSVNSPHNNSVWQTHSFAWAELPLFLLLRSLSLSLSLALSVSFSVALSMPMVNCECCLQRGKAQMSVQITSRTMSSGVDSARHVHWPWRGNSTKVISIPALSAILPYEWMQPPLPHTHTDSYCCRVVPFAIINNCSMRDFLLLFSFTSLMFLLLPLSVSLHLPTFCALLYWLSISLRFTICRLHVGIGTNTHIRTQTEATTGTTSASASTSAQLSSVHSCCFSSSSFCGSRFSAYFAAECVLLLFFLPSSLSPFAHAAF